MATDAATIPPNEGLGALVVELESELDERQMHFMRARWLDQTAGWRERRSSASAATTRFVWLRSSAV